jgi:redox-sensitive bicupin YhaK (pirin superfamily)
MLQHRSKETLDHGDRGWLKARHHFIVSAAGNPANGPLGSLVVWNDDEIAPSTGFGRHTHADMEIVTYVRQGAVTQRQRRQRRSDHCRRCPGHERRHRN